MKNSLLFCFLFLCFSFVYSQTTYTKKYNTILERNEYFDNSGKLIGYQKYNTITDALEYTDVTTTNSNESGRYIVHDYGTPKSNFDANLALQALAKRQQQQQQQKSYSNQYANMLFDKFKELQIKLNDYSDLDKREIALDMYNERAYILLENIVGKNINIYDYMNKLTKIYNETINSVNNMGPTLDSDYYFNIAVTRASQGFAGLAKENYIKALEIDSNHLSSLINLSVLILSDEDKIVEEMNNLGYSIQDKKRYEELSQSRKELYHNVIPYLEKAFKISPNNTSIQTTLSNIQKALNDNSNWLGGYTVGNVKDYKYDEATQSFILTHEIKKESLIYFSDKNYSFKRGDRPDWQQNLWNPQEIKGNVHSYFDERGNYIYVDVVSKVVVFFAGREGSSEKFTEKYVYSNLVKNSDVFPGFYKTKQ